MSSKPSTRRINDWKSAALQVAPTMDAYVSKQKAMEILTKQPFKNYLIKFSALKYIENNLDELKSDFIEWYKDKYPRYPVPTRESITSQQ